METSLHQSHKPSTLYHLNMATRPLTISTSLTLSHLPLTPPLQQMGILRPTETGLIPMAMVILRQFRILCFLFIQQYIRRLTRLTLTLSRLTGLFSPLLILLLRLRSNNRKKLEMLTMARIRSVVARAKLTNLARKKKEINRRLRPLTGLLRLKQPPMAQTAQMEFMPSMVNDFANALLFVCSHLNAEEIP